MVTYVAKGSLLGLNNLNLSPMLPLFGLLPTNGTVSAHLGIISAPPYVISFTGTFHQNEPADPLLGFPADFSGVVNTVTGKVTGSVFFTLTGMNVSLAELEAGSAFPVVVAADIFKGNDVIRGGALSDIVRG